MVSPSARRTSCRCCSRPDFWPARGVRFSVRKPLFRQPRKISGAVDVRWAGEEPSTHCNDREEGQEMPQILFRRLAVVGAVVALALPAAAQAGNEVTKWNEIAVTKVLAQPGLFSAPPAAA